MAKTRAKIRMYKVGELGDCFVISFSTGRTKSNVLIDCGSFRNGPESRERMNEVANSILKDYNSIDLLVATHQHNDHMSGFQHAKSVFEEMNIQNVALSWLDDPNDDDATEIIQQHRSIAGALNKYLGSEDIDPIIKQNVLQYADFAISPDSPTVHATEFLQASSTYNNALMYLSPGQSFDLPGKLPGKVRVKVHVLGPPKSYTALKDTTAKKRETYDPHLNKMLFKAATLDRALTKERSADAYPFDQNKIIQEEDFLKEACYKAYISDDWRSIKHAWEAQAESLAFHMDSYTNNTSIVLAFELIDREEYLLFVGDAQTGNWNSWKTVKWDDGVDRLDDILEKTIFYKVGHHGSHNATQPELFEKVKHPDLVAMIPVDKFDPNLLKKNPWRMPSKNLEKRLKEKTKERIIRMDDIEINEHFSAKYKGNINELFVEIKL